MEKKALFKIKLVMIGIVILAALNTIPEIVIAINTLING
jgi:Ca2+/Na+ antiporter